MEITMGHRNVILMFATMSFMGYYGSNPAVKRVIADIGIKERHYPKDYIMLGRKFRKIFKLQKKKIPKWTYFELCLSIVYIVHFLVMSLLYFVAIDKDLVEAIYMFSYVILMTTNSIYIMISVFRYR